MPRWYDNFAPAELGFAVGPGFGRMADMDLRDELHSYGARALRHVAALADGLTTVALLFGPAPVVVGGGLAQSGERLLAPLRSALAERARVFPAPHVLTARHGSRAGVVGAGMLARDGWKAET